MNDHSLIILILFHQNAKNILSFLSFQADVNDNDEDSDNNGPEATSPTKEADPELLIDIPTSPAASEDAEPQKLYPTAPQLDESDDTTSAHSTEV